MALRSPALTAARQALADAVAEAAEHRRSREALVRAGETAARAVSEAEAAVEAAQAGVERAKVDAGAYLEAQALGTATIAPRTTVEARRAVLDAEDHLAAARSAQDALGARTLASSSAELGLERRLGEATRAVIEAEAGPAALRLAAEVERLQRDLIAKVALLRAMVADGAVPVVAEFGGSYGKAADEKVRGALYRATRPPEEWIGLGLVFRLDGDHDVLASQWTRSVTGLRTDASTRLADVPARTLP